MKEHKAGFVSIIGKPNVGKSTLMNQLVGEKLSIITSKAQTTRHRIMGLLNGDDFQIVYSDTPGIIKPKYMLQESMMNFVKESLEDADAILFVTDIHEKYDENDVLTQIQKLDIPIILIINKIDTSTQEQVIKKMEEWKETLSPVHIVATSALHGFNIEGLLDVLIEYIPVHPPYFSKDDFTDKSMRFFASEIIREKIFTNYEQEIPYSTEVVVTSFKEDKGIYRISVDIICERTSQRSIIIGKGGSKLKKVGTEARKDMEEFFGEKVFLEQYVKVEEDWRKNKGHLKRFGYNQ